MPNITSSEPVRCFGSFSALLWETLSDYEAGIYEGRMGRPRVRRPLFPHLAFHWSAMTSFTLSSAISANSTLLKYRAVRQTGAGSIIRSLSAWS